MYMFSFSLRQLRFGISCKFKNLGNVILNVISVVDGEEHVESGCKLSITSTLLNHSCAPTVMSTIHG